MDVANSHHLNKPDYEADVTPEGVAEMRRRAAPLIEGQNWIVFDSAAERMGLTRAADRG